ncbi:LUD domain-containing protein (plasmid) [Halorussus salilacus]|uniref:LUD domain-containing protein n=1 Tax=Halorussus salilacus TaxID=2953750 RepID=UPI0020A02474|nr:LUD domain-containing protein [Halorussus salilacus]USZ69877.1 LUD domain-containing protein [Halorussus salilacus]
MTGLVQQFEREATDAGCEVRRVAAAEFADALADRLDPPAVGAPLPFEGVSLPDDVTTDPTPSDLESARTGVTPARFAVADYGSVAIRSTAAGDEPASLYPERHVAVVAASDVVGDMTAGVERLGEIARAGGDVVLATGPSATADMGELVVGAHGPRAVTVFVLEDR